MGNRVEKKVVAGETTTVSRYLRDASGNVMAVYNDDMMIEQPIYGSSRIGLYVGGSEEGKSILDLRRYELTNHLGNVLSVISDKVNMDDDVVLATVLTTSDYYPFGLTMTGRTWNDPSAKYRYGFNGKEKDSSTEWGDTEYDYGFRIYNPTIGRFLSVDPLTGSYPWYTPYQFAGNTPIMAFDVDGLEEQVAIDGSVWSGPIDMEKVNNEIIGLQQNAARQAMSLSPTPKPTIMRSFPSFTVQPHRSPEERRKMTDDRASRENYNKVKDSADPFVKGGGEFGLGFTETTGAAASIATLEVVPELAITRLSKIWKAQVLFRAARTQELVGLSNQPVWAKVSGIIRDASKGKVILAWVKVLTRKLLPPAKHGWVMGSNWQKTVQP